ELSGQCERKERREELRHGFPAARIEQDCRIELRQAETRPQQHDQQHGKTQPRHSGRIPGQPGDAVAHDGLSGRGNPYEHIGLRRPPADSTISGWFPCVGTECSEAYSSLSIASVILTGGRSKATSPARRPTTLGNQCSARSTACRLATSVTPRV